MHFHKNFNFKLILGAFGYWILRINLSKKKFYKLMYIKDNYYTPFQKQLKIYKYIFLSIFGVFWAWKKKQILIKK